MENTDKPAFPIVTDMGSHFSVETKFDFQILNKKDIDKLNPILRENVLKQLSKG